ncbi:MAG: FKBP-type peptidyl-prolyl cis-trans isomerase [Pseudomonadota bacterium]
MTFRPAAAAALLITLGACGGDKVSDTTPLTLAEIRETAVAREAGSTADYAPWDGDARDVQTTASGLKYIVLREGPDEGATPPSSAHQVTVMYEGRVAASGEKFDSSYDRNQPATFPLNRVIGGWTEGLQLMSEGDEFVFFIPTNLAYGDRPRPGGVIKPGDDLVFSVELLEISDPLPPPPPPPPPHKEGGDANTPWNSEAEPVQKTGSGLEYIVLESGDEAGAPPTGEQFVVIHYEGRFNEAGADPFDSSFQRGQAAVFPAQGFIPGFNEALSLMRPGDRWLIYIPSALAYGAEGKGSIPADTDLLFEVQLLDTLNAN